MTATDYKKYNRDQAYHLLKDQPKRKYDQVAELVTGGSGMTTEQIASIARVPVNYVYAVHADLIDYSW